MYTDNPLLVEIIRGDSKPTSYVQNFFNEWSRQNPEYFIKQIDTTVDDGITNIFIYYYEQPPIGVLG